MDEEQQRFEATSKAVVTVLSSPGRLPNDRVRDALRQPLDVIHFLDIKPNHRILDFSSWDGYWATLFVPLTRLPVWCHNALPWREFSEPLIQRRLALTDKTQNPNGTNPNGPLRFYYSDYGSPAPPVPPMCDDPKCTGCRTTWAGWENMYDLIFTYANYHDAVAELGGPSDTAIMLQNSYKLLRPGGHLVVIDHAAINGTGTNTTRDLHRIDELTVTAEVSAFGFELVDAFHGLRDPNDTKTGAAWAQDAPQVRTDRFALKFRKPGGPEQVELALQCMLGHW
ncbi:hypothetical protein HDU97_005977 [Phlyctochytrium planicorne]|nr:hypothetical protein HDU97_005977 [Phlyctochytrium planicorne]